VFSATSETRNRSANATNARKFLFAIRTTINVTRRVRFRRERQIVTTDFVADLQIAAGIAPFIAMRSDSASSNSKLREQMRQLVSQRAINLVNRQSGSDTLIRKSRVQ
jgi:hypothetical protein